MRRSALRNRSQGQSPLFSSPLFADARGQNTSKDDSLQKILDKREPVPGLDVEFPPLGFIDENGKGTRLDPVLADIILRMMSEDKGRDLREKDADGEE